MKVELLVSRAGPDGIQNRGDVIDVADDVAARMIAAEQALPVRSEKRETTAKRAKVEKT